MWWAYDPRGMMAWPNAKLAVMGGQQAANVLLQIEKSKLKKEGKKSVPQRKKNCHNALSSATKNKPNRRMLPHGCGPTPLFRLQQQEADLVQESLWPTMLP